MSETKMYKKLCKPSGSFKGIPEIYWHGKQKAQEIIKQCTARFNPDDTYTYFATGAVVD